MGLHRTPEREKCTPINKIIDNPELLTDKHKKI